MDFHQLKIFSEVFRLRSFTKASASLNISQPTISEHIKNLESELSCLLFDRLGRSIVPTQEGEMLFPRAQQLLDSLNRLRDDLTSSVDRVTGEIIFGASTIPGTYLVPNRVAGFARQYPEVTFEVIIEDTARIGEMILDHQLFCGIVGARLSSEKFSYQIFVQDELVLVANRDIWPKPEITLQQLTRLPFLLRERGSGTRKCMEEHFNRAGLAISTLETVATLGSTASVKEAAIQGLGATVLSSLAIKNELASDALHEIEIKGLEMKRDFFLVKHRQRTLPVHYQAFCDHLSNFAELSD